VKKTGRNQTEGNPLARPAPSFSHTVRTVSVPSASPSLHQNPARQPKRGATKPNLEAITLCDIMIVSSLNNALKIRKRWRRILITKPNHRAVYGSARSSFLPCSSPRKHKVKRTKNKELHRTVKNYSSATVFRRHDRRLLVRLNALSLQSPRFCPRSKCRQVVAADWGPLSKPTVLHR
jgi:hypothetical protein